MTYETGEENRKYDEHLETGEVNSSTFNTSIEENVTLLALLRVYIDM